MKKIFIAGLVLFGSKFAFANPGDVTVINTVSPQNGAFQYVVRSTNVFVSTQAFSNNLGPTDINLQHALNTLDQLTTSGGGGSSSSLSVNLGGVQISSPTSIINFSSNSFTATQSPTGQANIGINFSSIASQSNLTQYLTQTSAANTYLTQSSATTTYQPIGSYLTISSATVTYLQITSSSTLGKSPGGSDTNVQINHPNGTFYGDSGFQYDSSVSSITLGGKIGLTGAREVMRININQFGATNTGLIDGYDDFGNFQGYFGFDSANTSNGSLSLGKGFVWQSLSSSGGSNDNEIIRIENDTPYRMFLRKGPEAILNQNLLEFYNSAGTHYSAIRGSATITTDTALILPNILGAAGDSLVLQTVNGSTGTLVFKTITGGGGGSGSPLEVFNNFNTTESSPTLSIGMSNAFGGSVSGSTFTFAANTSSMTLYGPNLPAGAITAAVSAITGLGAQAQALNMNSHLINNVTDPSSPQDAATKNYVDTTVNGLDWKASCFFGTTSALPTNAYNNGSSGVNATLTGISFGALSIDGYTPSVGQRILVKNEAVTANNGIYTVTTVGSGIAVYVLTRATDYNQSAEIAAGDAVFVTSGTINNDSSWIMTTNGTITVGTTAINWSQFAATYSAGVGLTLNGTQFSVNSASGTLQGNTFNGSNQLLLLNSAGLIQNSNIDGSSVTKYGTTLPSAALSGALPNSVLVSSLPITGIIPGSYTNTNLTVDAYGRLSSASNGSASGNSINNQNTLQSGATAYPSFLYIGSTATFFGETQYQNRLRIYSDIVDNSLSAGTSGQFLMSRGSGNPVGWNTLNYLFLPGTQTVSGQNTYTSEQDFNNRIRIKSDIVDNGASAGAIGQALLSNGSGNAVLWATIPALTSTQTWSGIQTFNTNTGGIQVAFTGNGLVDFNGSKVRIRDSLGNGGTTNQFLMGNGTSVVWSNVPAIAISSGILSNTVVASSASVTMLVSSFPITGVIPGSYTNTNLTVDAYGHISSANNGSTSGGFSIYGATATANFPFGLSSSTETITSTLTITGIIGLPDYTITGGSGISHTPGIFDTSNPSIGINFQSGNTMQFWQKQGSTSYISQNIGATEIDFATNTVIEQGANLTFQDINSNKVSQIYYSPTLPSIDISTNISISGGLGIGTGVVDVTNPPLNGLLVQGNINNQALTGNKSVCTDINKNLITTNCPETTNSEIKTTNYIITSTDSVIIASGAITVTLPSAANAGEVFTIVKMDRSTSTVLVQAPATELIANTTDQYRMNAPGQSIQLVSDGGFDWAPLGSPTSQPPYVGVSGDPNSTQVVVASTVYCNAFQSTTYLGITDVRMNVGAAAGKMQVGIYDSNGSEVAISTAVTTGTGQVTIPLSSVAFIGPGTGWICMGDSSATASITRQAASTAIGGACQFTAALPLSATKAFLGCTLAANYYSIIGLVGGGGTK